MVHEDEFVIQGLVADGCSTGKKSGFASQLFCNLFEVQAKRGHIIVYDRAIRAVIDNLKMTRSILELDVDHLLSTLVLFTYIKSTKTLQVRVFGDGFYYVNGQEFKIEQNNEPDYIAYHIHNKMNDFLEKYSLNTYEDVDTFTVSSDGIESFAIPQSKESSIDPKQLLLSANTSSNHLERKFNIIKKQGWLINDDLTLISYQHD